MAPRGRKTPAVADELYADLAGIDVGDGYPVRIVAVINVSPESFYGESVTRSRKALQRRAELMMEEGADVIDVGAMSTAPYRRNYISEAEERKRVTAALHALRDVARVPLSVDTQRSSVAATALAEGATIVNDVSGLRDDPRMAQVACNAGGVILMAREQGGSDLAPIAYVAALLRQALRRANAAGIDTERIVLDPGIGFFRKAKLPWDEFDCTVLDGLRRLRRLERPLLVGSSRKSFIGKLTGRTDTADRLNGSLGAAAVAVYNGAAMLRTHDVAATRDAARVAAAIRGDRVALKS